MSATDFPKVSLGRIIGPVDVCIIEVGGTNTESPLAILDNDENAMFDIQNSPTAGSVRCAGGFFIGTPLSILRS